MPRKVFDIPEFKYGIISAVDEEDIPPEAASDSLNIDGDVGEGILRGIPSDTELTVDIVRDGTANESLAYVRSGRFIEHGGIYDLIYHDSYANKINAICDFYGTPQKLTDLTPSVTIEDSTTIIANNKQVYIGVGHSQTAYWIGYVDHTMFSYGTSLTITDITDSGGQILLTVDTTGTEMNIGHGNIVKISGVVGTDPCKWKMGCRILQPYVMSTTGTILLKGSTYTRTILTCMVQ